MHFFNMRVTTVYLLAVPALMQSIDLPPVQTVRLPPFAMTPDELNVGQMLLGEYVESAGFNVINNGFTFTEQELLAITSWGRMQTEVLSDIIADLGKAGLNIGQLAEGMRRIIPTVNKFSTLVEEGFSMQQLDQWSQMAFNRGTWKLTGEELEFSYKRFKEPLRFGKEWSEWKPQEMLTEKFLTKAPMTEELVQEVGVEAEALIEGARAGAAPAEELIGSLENVGGNMFSEAVEIPVESLEGMATMSTEGVIIGAEGGELAGIAAGAATAMEIGAEGGAVEGTIIATEGGLLAAGAASLGVSVAVAVLMAAAGFMVMPLIEALHDTRKTVKLHGFVTDIDGDGKPEMVNDYMSKLTPGNTFLYHKVGGMQGFFNHLFKKKEKMTFDFEDPTYGHVWYSWKGDAAAGQNFVIGVIEDTSLSDDQKALKILNILESPNHGGNKLHDKIELYIDTDHDGIQDEIKIKYKGKNEQKDKLEIKGDIDGDGVVEKCKYHDGRMKGCKHD